MIAGLKQMLWGFVKKLVVADRLSIYVDSIYNNPDLHNGSSVALASAFFAIQIYCDFSAYSDIAIGSARTMGFDLMTNFKRPYFSKSIQEFWSKWHISLSTWFRDYVYIPLGGSRTSRYKWYFNLFVVFMVSGIWHGANYTFIVWGALHAFYQVIGIIVKPPLASFEEKYSLKNNGILKAVKIVFIFCIVTFAWIFFRASSINDALILIGNLKTFGAQPFLGNGINHFSHCILAVVILFTVEYYMEFKPHVSLFSNQLAWVRWASVITAIFVILIFGVFNGGQFIYFQF